MSEKQKVDPSLEVRDIVRLLAVLAVAIRNGEVPPLGAIKKIHIPKDKEVEGMTFNEFRERYNRTAVRMVLECFERYYKTGSDQPIEKICDHELEPGKFVARAFYDSAHHEVIYEEYYYIDDPEKLTPESTPDVYHHVEIPEDFATRATLRTYLSEWPQIYDKINEIDKAINEARKEAKEFKFGEHTIETEEGLVVICHNQDDDDFARVEIYEEMSEDDYTPQMAPVPDTTIYVWYEEVVSKRP